MKKTNIIITLWLFTFMILSCSDIESLQEDPNRTTKASPELLLTHLEIQAFSKNVSTSSALANRYMTFIDNQSPYQYYTWQRSNFKNYENITQAVRMSAEASRIGKKVYKILSKFFISHFIIELTERFGDIPYTEAIKLESKDISKPKYDSQKEIYLKVLAQLKSAADELTTNTESISGDVIYKGDKLKWRKLINSYHLRVLMSLSKKNGKDGINLAPLFKEILDNPTKYPIFESNKDAGVIQYVDVKNNRYPLHNNNSLQTAYYLEKTFVNRLVTLKDPRLFTIADRTPKAIKAGLPTEDFNAYGGLLGSTPFSNLAIAATKGEASRINPRYYNNPTNLPGVLMSYAELQFILAEAIEKGYISGNAKTYYNRGIKASMNFYGIDSQSEIQDYINQNSVKLEGNNAIKQIMIQKHIALFLNSGWQMYYEQRRTGYPNYDISGGGIGGRVPKRFLYPKSEFDNNKVNLEKAIARQFSSDENINAEMWLIK